MSDISTDSQTALESVWGDKHIMDFLDSLKPADGGGWAFRESKYGRGWRLHHTTCREYQDGEIYSTAREAVQNHPAFKQYLEKLSHAD